MFYPAIDMMNNCFPNQRDIQFSVNDEAEFSESTEKYTATPSTQRDSQKIIDSKRISTEIATLSYRTEIFASVIPAIQRRPITLLIGDSSDRILPTLQSFVGREVQHWHNSFLQVLMTAGLPAMLFAVAFIFLLVMKCIKMISAENTPLAEQVLILPVAGIILHAMVEDYLFFNGGLQNTLFFLLAGFLFADHSNPVQIVCKTSNRQKCTTL